MIEKARSIKKGIIMSFKEMVKNDVWNPNLSPETVKPFIDYRYYEKFLNDRLNRNANTTNRETAIMFGLPSKLIEGVFVGRKVEQDKELLNYTIEKIQNIKIISLP